jgi:uncharacterized membrane protein YkgB
MSNPIDPSVLSDTVLRSYGGIGRRVMFFSIWPLAFVWAIAKRDNAMILGAVIIVTAVVVLIHFRMKNIGHSQWAWTLALVPLANLFVLGYCMIVPRGYADTRKLDGWAYLLLTPFVILAIAILMDFLAMTR